MATAFLGFHFILRMFKRLVFIKSAGLKDFFNFYREDRIVALSMEEKNLLPAFGRCVSCGLCDSECPAIVEGQQGAQQAAPLRSSFLPHFSRSIPDFAAVLPENFISSFAHCDECRGCEAICPERVPIRKILEFMESKRGFDAGFKKV